jgi:ribosome-associated heat shock protein Hsp15
MFVSTAYGEKSPGHSVKMSDVLTIRLDRGVRILKVTGFVERRGDSTVARTLYDDMSDVSGGADS